MALGALLYLLSIEGFMKNDLKSINEMANAKKMESDIFKQVSMFIFTHSNVKQLSERQLIVIVTAF